MKYNKKDKMVEVLAVALTIEMKEFLACYAKKIGKKRTEIVRDMILELKEKANG